MGRYRCSPETAERRFWSKVSKVTFPCWEWIGCKDVYGYGRFDLSSAHRFSYILHFGNIPDDLCVLHHCDNRACVNPEHLYAGTFKDNAQDRKNRGRNNSPTGEKNGRKLHPESYPIGEDRSTAKLTWAIVREIRAKYVPRKYHTAMLAKEYGISQSVAYRIVTNNLWRE